MKRLPGLAEALRPALALALLGRLAVWLALSLMALAVAGFLSLLATTRSWIGPQLALEIRLGALLISASVLPAFVLWPPPAGLLWKRLRQIDEDTVFEAYLEAPPGPGREVLSRLAEEKAATISYRRPILGLGAALGRAAPLLALALAALVLAEAGSLIAFSRPLALLYDPAARRGGGERLQEDDFSQFAGESAETRKLREAQRRAGENGGQDGEQVGAIRPDSGRAGGGSAAQRRARQGGEFELPDLGPGGTTPRPTEGGAGTAAQAEQAAGEPTGRMQAAPGKGGPQPTALGKTGQGFEKTGDTRVPSPLLDYRSRFSTVFAERTGKRIQAADELGLGELRDYERRYFGSFALEADIGQAEDAYAALLKTRWRELRGGLR